MDITQPAGDVPPHAQGQPGPPRVRLNSPAGLLAAVPHLIGFHPVRSLVVVGAGGPRREVKLGFRYDLPDPPSARRARQIAGHACTVLAHHRVTTVIAAGYGPGKLVTPLMDAFGPATRRAGLALQDMLRVEDGRYWSYLCRDPACCPPAGVAFDPQSHPAAAALAVAGLAPYPDREALAATLAPLSGDRGQARDLAAQRAGDRAAALLQQAAGERGGDPFRLVVADGLRAVRRAISQYRAGQAITDDDTLAWLALCLNRLPVRDDAWARMEPGHRDAHLRLWTDLVRHAIDGWVPAPAALLAFTAWQGGDGALASVALDRALAADPSYSMALLLADILSAGVPPSAARLPMTPQEAGPGIQV